MLRSAAAPNAVEQKGKQGMPERQAGGRAAPNGAGRRKSVSESQRVDAIGNQETSLV